MIKEAFGLSNHDLTLALPLLPDTKAITWNTLILATSARQPTTNTGVLKIKEKVVKVKDKTSKLLTSQEEQIRRWFEHFKDRFTISDSPVTNLEHRSQVARIQRISSNVTITDAIETIICSIKMKGRPRERISAKFASDFRGLLESLRHVKIQHMAGDGKERDLHDKATRFTKFTLLSASGVYLSTALLFARQDHDGTTLAYIIHTSSGNNTNYTVWCNNNNIGTSTPEETKQKDSGNSLRSATRAIIGASRRARLKKLSVQPWQAEHEDGDFNSLLSMPNWEKRKSYRMCLAYAEQAADDWIACHSGKTLSIYHVAEIAAKASQKRATVEKAVEGFLLIRPCLLSFTASPSSLSGITLHTSSCDIISLPKLKVRGKRPVKGLKSVLLTSTPNKESLKQLEEQNQSVGQIEVSKTLFQCEKPTLGKRKLPRKGNFD
ncbi:hypothetical protein ILUMI_22782 [Ignelater luminosus]|uniref:Uncharacterized protein n=1 Tax=Ignelater luminosus TaxID=2038154 RepID=A0A8K0G2H8_IGNLU|nr:hypothetical protein ILUMI_22782 [Ignelater luminosus]